MNFFDNRGTNAAAESFNAKVKDFRRTFRGVRDIQFFPVDNWVTEIIEVKVVPEA